MSLPTHPLFEIYPSPALASSSYTPTGKLQAYVDNFISRSLWFSPLIESAKSLISLLPGRFSTANLSGEAVYALLSLVSYYNSGVLGKPRASPYDIKVYQQSFDISAPPSSEARTINGTLAAFSMLESLFEQGASLYFIRRNYAVFKQLFGPLSSQQFGMGLDDPLSLDTIASESPSDGGLTTPLSTKAKNSRARPHQFKACYPHQLQPPTHFGEAADGSSSSSAPPHTSTTGTSGNPILPVYQQDRLRMQFNSKMRQFKMIICFAIEAIKFICRMRMFFSVNNGQINIPPSPFDTAMNQTQRQGEFELQQYLGEQDTLRNYNIAYKQWLNKTAELKKEEQVLTTKKAEADQQQNRHEHEEKQEETKDASSSRRRVAKSSNSVSIHGTNAAQVHPVEQALKSLKKTQRIHLKAKPTQPLTASAFISPLTSSHVSNATSAKGKGSQPAQVPSALMDSPSLQALKTMYMSHGRGRVKHGQFGMNVIKTYYLHYHIQQDQRQKAQSQLSEKGKDDAIEDLSIIGSTTPSDKALEYFTGLFSVQRPASQPSSSSSKLVSPISSQISLQHTSSHPAGGAGAQQYQHQANHLDMKTVFSEVIYWARPVVYSFLCIFFQQSSWLPVTISGLLDFIAWYLSPSFKLSRPHGSQQQQSHDQQQQQQQPGKDDQTGALEQSFYQKTYHQQLQLEQAAAWAGRKSGYWLYLLRSPLFESIVLTPLNIIGRIASHIPVIGMVVLYIIEILKMVQQHYFYTSGS